MKSTAARKSSHSPRPSSHAPALRPTPRKLNRSTAQPIRASAFAPWKTAFVCIVPPCVGSGGAKTTAARGSPAGFSIRTSRGPEGPGISRTVSGTFSRRVGRHESGDERRKFVRTRDHAEVTGAGERFDARMRPDREIFARNPRRKDPFQRFLARQNHRRYFDVSQLRVDASGRTEYGAEQMHTSRHSARVEHMQKDIDA